MFKKSVIIFKLIFVGLSVFSQDILKIAPPSPTVASLARYGDVPVSLYTGSPNISIPIYEIKTSDFNLPISLSYNASGIKVEEIASWVGLGWSLNAGGIVSRTVHGIPDEINGYLTGQKISDILELSGLEQAEIYRSSANGNYPDLEPDIFYFNFGSHSGKFFYNQESEEFVTIPRKAITIDKDYFIATGKWKITTEDGAIFHFELSEENTNFTSCNGNASSLSTSKTGWFLTKIITPISKSEINFSYVPNQYVIKNIASTTLYGAPEGSILPACIVDTNPEVCISQNSYNGYRLSSIVYPQGSIDFIATTNRSDLLGDKRLDEIAITHGGETGSVTRFRFDYDYFNSEELNSPISAEAKAEVVRLKLKKITQLDVLGSQQPPYIFSYNETAPLPSRMSYSQDNWGYYNGKVNTHLVPPMRLGHLLFPGADRSVDDAFTSLGILTKMTYPTGGFTELNYENHEVLGMVPYSENENYIMMGAYLDQSNYANQEHTIFSKEIVIQDGALMDGVFVNIGIWEIYNCDLCPNGLPSAQSCAVLTLESATYSLPITCNVSNIFVPSGTYTLKANFTQNTNVTNYENFVIFLSWSEYVDNEMTNSKVGGLRIKEITDSDGSSLKSTHYQYENMSNESTGQLVTVSPVYEYTLPCYDDAADIQNMRSGPFLTRKSYSNYPLSTTQGSFIGYSEVTVARKVNGELGKTISRFSSPNDHWDLFDDSFKSVYLPTHYPFAPRTSYDHRRGLLLWQEDYAWNDGTFQKIKKIENEYQPLDVPVDSSKEMLPGFSTTKGIKIGIFGRATGDMSVGLAAIHKPYSIDSEWIRHVKTTETSYTQDGEIEVVSNMDYDNSDHQQLTKSTVIQSDGTTNTTYLRYPMDYGLIPQNTTDASSLGIKNLQDEHYITNVVEQYVTYKDSNGPEVLVKGIVSTFREDIPRVNNILVFDSEEDLELSAFDVSAVDSQGNFLKDSSYKARLEFSAYDDIGNLLEQRYVGNAPNSYVWGYDHSYPIAEVINAHHSELYYTSFEEEGTVDLEFGGSKTGIKYWEGSSYTIPVNQRPVGGNLKMTYWYFVNGVWNFQSEIDYQPTVYNENATRIDEVRVYPAGAMMTTYTYKIGCGVSSITDPNNSVTYFEYDNFNRLKWTKDSNGSILSTYVYQYKSSE